MTKMQCNRNRLRGSPIVEHFPRVRTTLELVMTHPPTHLSVGGRSINQLVSPTTILSVCHDVSLSSVCPSASPLSIYQWVCAPSVYLQCFSVSLPACHKPENRHNNIQDLLIGQTGHSWPFMKTGHAHFSLGQFL